MHWDPLSSVPAHNTQPCDVIRGDPRGEGEPLGTERLVVRQGLLGSLRCGFAVVGRNGPQWAAMGRNGPQWAAMGFTFAEIGETFRRTRRMLSDPAELVSNFQGSPVYP